MVQTDDANSSDAQSATAGSAADPEAFVPIIEVAFRNDRWWAMPPDLSAHLYAQYIAPELFAGESVSYTWGERTYTIDFEAMVQTNNANGRRRTIRIVQVRLDETTPPWTGEIPEY